MKKLIIILLLGAAYWQFYLGQPGNPLSSPVATDASYATSQLGSSSLASGHLLPSSSISQPVVPVAGSGYRCDGRTHCSQMTSCAEATFFLRNCPGVKMDGNYDGVPCEQQWCK